MISIMACLLFFGLIVFGPKKTIEFAQDIGRQVARVKDAAGKFQESGLTEDQPTVLQNPR
jgi:Sec-independent protein translocase protein TatA